MLRSHSNSAGFPQANGDWSHVAWTLKKTVTPEDWNTWGHLFYRVFRGLRKRRVASPQIAFETTRSPCENILTNTPFARHHIL